MADIVKMDTGLRKLLDKHTERTDYADGTTSLKYDAKAIEIQRKLHAMRKAEKKSRRRKPKSIVEGME